jgi:hypothetical protein
MKRRRNSNSFPDDYVSKVDRRKADILEEVIASELRNSLAMVVFGGMVLMFILGFWCATPW